MSFLLQPSPSQELKKRESTDIDKSIKVKSSLPATIGTPTKASAPAQAGPIDRSQQHLSTKPPASVQSAQSAPNRPAKQAVAHSDPDKKPHTATELIDSDKEPSKAIGNMSSNTAGQAAKAGNKVAIDHQATLDKGLKMKIKRTKPGTKTSEAKHEIVKAEQNGSLSGADDSNSSSSGSNGGSKKLTMQNQQSATTAGQQQTASGSTPAQATPASQQLSPNST